MRESNLNICGFQETWLATQHGQQLRNVDSVSDDVRNLSYFLFDFFLSKDHNITVDHCRRLKKKAKYKWDA